MLAADIDLAESPLTWPTLNTNCGGTWRTRVAVERRPGMYGRIACW